MIERNFRFRAKLSNLDVLLFTYDIVVTLLKLSKLPMLHLCVFPCNHIRHQITKHLFSAVCKFVLSLIKNFRRLHPIWLPTLVFMLQKFKSFGIFIDIALLFLILSLLSSVFVVAGLVTCCIINLLMDLFILSSF